jgi:hypothetical protein
VVKRRMDSSTLNLFALKYEGRATDADFVEWAVDQLQSGRDPEPVVILAGLSAPLNAHEVQQYFDQGIKALGIDPPSREEALRWKALQLVNRLSEREIGQEELEADVRRLAGLCVLLDYPDDLFVWYDLDEEVHDRFSFMAMDKWKMAVREAAASALSGASGA